MLRISGLTLLPGQEAELALTKALQRLKIQQKDVRSWRVSRKSLDARDKGRIHYVISLDLKLAYGEEALAQKHQNQGVTLLKQAKPAINHQHSQPFDAVVVGLGPCGLFAALRLAQAGVKPIVLERGQPIYQRARDVSALMQKGILSPESNLQFGEGGAGAFSDGKLTTGIKDPLCKTVLDTLHQFGAQEEILFLQRPHIGTDRLPGVVSRIRQQIEQLGGQVHFGAKFEKALYQKGQLSGVEYEVDGQTRTLPCQALVLAIGHSARDTQRQLVQAGLNVQPKPFSLGLRIEHPQDLINQAQYGPQVAKSGLLPPAEYHLATRLADGRGCYTFCMCPGGRVVPAASEEGGVCVNGMSNSKRDLQNANAALLVEVRPADYMQGEDPLSGFAWQRHFERLAFDLAGGGYRAPAQLVGDFLHQQPSSSMGEVKPSYRPGVVPTDLSKALPDFVAAGIRQAIPLFDRKLRGFAMKDAVLTGVEARSSCPVQVQRDADFRSSLQGVYPAGEGAGRAGGIMSAAVEGLRCAEKVLEHMNAKTTGQAR